MTPESQRRLLRMELDLGADASTDALVDGFWEFYVEKAYVAPRLRYLYTKRSLCEKILFNIADDVDWKAGTASESQNQRHQNYQKILKTTLDEIRAIENRARANRTPVVGVMENTAILVDSTVQWSDPNDRMYRGDPIKRTSLPTKGV